MLPFAYNVVAYAVPIVIGSLLGVALWAGDTSKIQASIAATENAGKLFFTFIERLLVFGALFVISANVKPGIDGTVLWIVTALAFGFVLVSIITGFFATARRLRKVRYRWLVLVIASIVIAVFLTRFLSAVLQFLQVLITNNKLP